jgi:hypothetical protein
MDLKEIKEFFAEVDAIPQEKKDSITKFLFGVSLLISDSDKLTDLFFKDEDFEELYQSFVDSIIKDENLVEKDMILKRIADEKELIEKIHKYYTLKAEMEKISVPLGLYGSVMQNGFGNMNFFLLMSIFNIGRSFSPSNAIGSA